MAKELELKMREDEIRPDEYAEKIAFYAKEDKKILMKYKDDFVEVSCPACGKDDSKFAFMKIGVQYLECNLCRTVYASPRPTPKILKRYYENSKNYWFWNKYVFPASERARREKIVKPRVDILIEYCRRFSIKTDIIVEIGAGFGTFCEEVKNRNLFKRVIGIELTPDLAQTCRERGIEVIEKPVEEVVIEKAEADVIASFETIEHLFSPRDFIRSCVKLLKSNGLLILSCPNMFGFDTMTLRTRSKSVGGCHINMFNPDSIKILLSGGGLEVVDVKTPGKLDAEIVRKSILSGEFNVSSQPFLNYILIDRWEEVEGNFQKFLVDNLLSSHMMAVARKS